MNSELSLLLTTIEKIVSGISSLLSSLYTVQKVVYVIIIITPLKVIQKLKGRNEKAALVDKYKLYFILYFGDIYKE